VKILIDESLPRALKRALPDYEVWTVQEMGWTGAKNGDLLRMAEPLFAVFLTSDKNLRYQQNLAGRRLTIVVFPSNRLNRVLHLAPELLALLPHLSPGQFIELAAT
jgi:predicted nuclease of predicted toxin-antitoxin system